MPSVYEAAKLSQYVYDTDKHCLPAGWQEIIQTEKVSGAYPSGYCAALLINIEKKEFVIAHRGPKFKAFPDLRGNPLGVNLYNACYTVICMGV